MPTLILKVLIIEFMAGAVFSAAQRNWPMALYYAGAAILNIGVLAK